MSKWLILAGLTIVVAAFAAFLPERLSITELACGTKPDAHQIANSPWAVTSEEYSCGVSSGWTEVRAVNEETKVRIKLLSFDEIEEFAVHPTPHGIELIASNLAHVVCYRS